MTILAWCILVDVDGLFCQDTVFEKSIDLPEYVNNVDGDGKTIIARTNRGIYEYNDGEFDFLVEVKDKTRKYSFLTPGSRVQNIVTFNSTIVDKNKVGTVEQWGNKLPGYFYESITHARKGNELLLAYKGKILKYVTQNYYAQYLRGLSIRNIYVDEHQSIIASYQGIFKDSTFNEFRYKPLSGLSYSNGEIAKINDKFWICFDGIASLTSDEIIKHVEVYDQFKYRKLIEIDPFHIAALTDYSVVILDSTLKHITDTIIRSTVILNDLDLRNDTLFSISNSGDLLIFGINTKELKTYHLCDKALYDINILQNKQLLISAEDGLYKFDIGNKKASKLIHHDMVIQSVVMKGNIIFTTYNGLFLLKDNKIITIIKDVEFNKRGLTYFDNYIYAGSIEGLFVINWNKITEELLTSLASTVIDQNKYRTLLFLSLAILGISIMAYLIKLNRKINQLEILVNKKQVITPELIRDIVFNNEDIISVEDIARYLDTSIVQLGRHLKKHDTTPLGLLKEIKKELAKSMHSSNKSLSEIAQRLGYREAYVKKHFLNN